MSRDRTPGGRTHGLVSATVPRMLRLASIRNNREFKLSEKRSWANDRRASVEQTLADPLIQLANGRESSAITTRSVPLHGLKTGICQKPTLRSGFNRDALTFSACLRNRFRLPGLSQLHLSQRILKGHFGLNPVGEAPDVVARADMRCDPKVQFVWTRDEAERRDQMAALDLVRHQNARGERHAEAVGGSLNQQIEVLVALMRAKVDVRSADRGQPFGPGGRAGRRAEQPVLPLRSSGLSSSSRAA